MSQPNWLNWRILAETSYNLPPRWSLSLRELWSWASCPWLCVLTEAIERFRSNIILHFISFQHLLYCISVYRPLIPSDRQVTIIIAPRRRSPFILPSMIPVNQVPVRRVSYTPAIACSKHESARTITRPIVEIRSGFCRKVARKTKSLPDLGDYCIDFRSFLCVQNSIYVYERCLRKFIGSARHFCLWTELWWCHIMLK